MAGSLSLSGDVTLGSDGTDTITINGATSAANTLFVLGATALNRATSMTGTVGLGNEATDIVSFSGSVTFDALTVTGAAYVQCAVTLGDEATDEAAIVGRHDLHRWRRDPFWRGHSG